MKSWTCNIFNLRDRSKLWNIFDLGFSKLSSDFSPQCLCIEEFQSKYHREEQIWAQIWLKSENYSNCPFWRLEFSLFLRNQSFAKKSFLLSSSSIQMRVVPGFICSGFYGFFAVFLPRKTRKNFSATHFPFDLALQRGGAPLKCRFKFAFLRIKQLKRIAAKNSTFTKYRFKRRFPA